MPATSPERNAFDLGRDGELTSADHNRERTTFARDAVRLNRLRLMGWTVLRFTADDVLRHAARVVAQVRAAFAMTNVPIET